MRKLTTQQFLDRCQKIHGNQYDYSSTEYRNMRTQITIICPTHGKFVQCPKDHLNQKQGCPLCGNKKKNLHRQLTTAAFIKKANKVHGNLYDYMSVCYLNHSTKIIIICKIHGKFQQFPGNHLNGSGCTTCSRNISIPETEWLTGLNISELKRNSRIFLSNGKYYKPDGYDPITNTVYEFWGDFWHGNPDVFDHKHMNTVVNKTFGELYEDTKKKIKTYEKHGYNVVCVWENDFKSYIRDQN